jgi:hypothetical protein
MIPRKTPQQFYDARVVRGDGCWGWTGKTDGFGYGVVQLGRGEPRSGAHRVSWRLHCGPIPDGLHVLHRCDNPPCTRPDHLFLGTALDNQRDASAKGRLSVAGKGWLGLRTHCPRGHAFDEANTKVHNGVRLCRKCRAENQRDYKRRKGAEPVHCL